MRTERPIVAVKLFNTENRSSVSAAVPVETGTGEPLTNPKKCDSDSLRHFEEDICNSRSRLFNQSEFRGKCIEKLKKV